MLDHLTGAESLEEVEEVDSVEARLRARVATEEVKLTADEQRHVGAWLDSQYPERGEPKAAPPSLFDGVAEAG